MNSLIVFKENILLCGVLFAVVLISALLLVGCAKSGTEDFPPDFTSETMLIDYYRTDKAAADGEGYLEMVLYTTDNKDVLKLSIYSRENAEADENRTDYTVPYEVAERCYGVIKEHKLRLWNDIEEPMSIDGSLTVCKYYDGYEYIRVSTDKMPYNGQEILDMIGDVMAEYINENNSFSDIGIAEE